jgi:16S rRNA G966 N2-methylase RsmD
MNFIYAINFAPGFEELVAGPLKGIDAEIVFSEEAFAIVKLNKEVKISELRFAKSVIEVFDSSSSFKDLELTLPNSFEAPEGRTFSIRNFESGRPAKMEGATRASLIRDISARTKLRYSAFEPDVDFVIAKRRDGMSYFGYKLATNSSERAQRGEINSDIANLLLNLGEIKPHATVLDAFAGYGGISKEIVGSFAPEQVIAVEKNSTLVNKLKTEFGKKSKVRAVASDVVHFLKSTEIGFDLIIADPPWGEFEDYSGDLGKLYFDFLVAANKKLNAGGRIVIMSSAKEVLEGSVLDSEINVCEKLNVLVSGKKVLVLKLGES